MNQIWIFYRQQKRFIYPFKPLVLTKEIYIYIYLFVGGLQYDLFLSRELQYNLIRSHAAGVGTPLNPEKTRRLLALRINVLAKGHSGISLTILYALIKAFNGKEIRLSQQFSQSINYHVYE